MSGPPARLSTTCSPRASPAGRARALRPQRPAGRRRGSPTTAGSGPPCRPSRRCSDAGARVVVTAHLGRPEGRRRTRSTRSPRSPARLGELLGAPVPLAELGDGRRRGRRAGRRRRRAAGERPLRPARDQQGRRRARRAGRASWPRWPAPTGRSSPTGSASCTASRPRCTTSRSGCRPTPAAWCSPRSRCCARLTDDPERPYAVVLGGSKVSDKLAVIDALLPKVDSLLVGGGMCFTFLAAQGHGVGDSLLEADQIDTCRRLLESGKIVLPTDVVVADEFAADANTRTVAGRRDPGRLDGPRHRPGVGRGVRRGARRRRRRCSGTGRWACSSWPRSPRAPAAWRRRSSTPPRRRVQRRRRRRLRRRRPGARPGRGRLLAHLHRRRRVAGVPRGQGPARRRRPGGADAGRA